MSCVPPTSRFRFPGWTVPTSRLSHRPCDAPQRLEARRWHEKLLLHLRRLQGQSNFLWVYRYPVLFRACGSRSVWMNLRSKKVQLTGFVEHPFRIIPIVGKVLVVKDRNRALALFENPNNLLVN